MTTQNKTPSTPSEGESYPDTFLQGVMVGLLIGCALVLWFSPQSGRELYETIRKRLPLPAANPTDRRR